MIEYILTFLTIYSFCLFKFIAGPILGTAAGFSIVEIVFVTVLGMMSSVIGFTYIGQRLRIRYQQVFKPKRKIFTKNSRRVVKVWRNFGAIGVAAITPLVLTPIGGTIIMNSFGVKKEKIFTYMLVSSIFWALMFSSCIDLLLKIPVLQPFLTQAVLHQEEFQYLESTLAWQSAAL
ncbi:hypothetical protein [Litoribacter ruber]|uniref:hypothetical protein n=1 Tax=Litoribacter ruber TaxID=702568 RepID=UPI001FE77A5A|nr:MULTISPECIES: hypothetical protein [Litoribacter]